MKKYLLRAKTYITDHKKEFTTGAVVVGVVAVVMFSLALYSYNTAVPKIVYEPARACDLLTMQEATELLGDATINGVATNPIQTGDITTSNCSYSDGKADTENAVVAAIRVRSGINDAGIELNKTQFVNGKPADNVVDVQNVGDQAYFNQILGQLNILKESTWIVLSYGSGAAPEANTLKDALKLADKVLN